MSLLATRRKLLRSRRGLLMAILQGADIAEVVVQPTYSFNFVSDNSLPPGATFTRATSANFFGSNGLLQTASTNILRRDYGQNTFVALGALIEESRTNLALWNRDFTNIVWVKTTMTAALDQVGIDGINNACSSLLALAPLATALQTITLASAARAESVYIKRLVGTGAISLTQDGISYTPISPAPSITQWTRYELDATVLNPVFGIQIANSGDKIAVDYSQLEPGVASVFATSPIFTTAAAVTRAADTLVGPIGSWFNPISGTSIFVGDIEGAQTAAGQVAIQFDDGSENNVSRSRRAGATSDSRVSTISGGVADGSVTGSNWTINIRQKIAYAYGPNDLSVASNGVLGTQDSSLTAPVGISTIRFGVNSAGALFLCGHIAQFTYYNQRLSNAQLVELST